MTVEKKKEKRRTDIPLALDGSLSLLADAMSISRDDASEMLTSSIADPSKMNKIRNAMAVGTEKAKGQSTEDLWDRAERMMLLNWMSRMAGSGGGGDDMDKTIKMLALLNATKGHDNQGDWGTALATILTSQSANSTNLLSSVLKSQSEERISAGNSEKDLASQEADQRLNEIHQSIAMLDQNQSMPPTQKMKEMLGEFNEFIKLQNEIISLSKKMSGSPGEANFMEKFFSSSQFQDIMKMLSEVFGGAISKPLKPASGMPE